MSSSPDTSGKNFPQYIPKVAAGDRLSSNTINKLSAAVMRNSITSGVNALVARTASGTSISVRKKPSSLHPFQVECGEGAQGKKVRMLIGNVWSGDNKDLPTKLLYPYNGGAQKTPWGQFDSDISSAVMSDSYPARYEWNFEGGNKVVWIESQITGELPKLKYTSLEEYETKASEGLAIPIAVVNEEGLVFQIVKEDIWLDPLGVAATARHPFQVSLVSSSAIRIEQGMLYTYPNNFVATGSGDYPNAIKVSEALGGGYLLNSENRTFTVGASDYIYLKFKREIVNGSDYSGISEDNAWTCTLEIGATLPANEIYGNYNKFAAGACLDEMPPCGDPVVIPDPYGGSTVTYQRRNVKFLSWGTQIYPIAKMQLAAQQKVLQMLRSDFFFYPPMDAKMSFVETYVGNSDIPV